MKFVVVRGFQDPRDRSQKQRYAVVLGMDEGKVLIAPCTTYPQRNGVVPRGSALLTNQSPAYAGSGFTAEQIAISIRDVGMYSIDSSYVQNIQQVGTLNAQKDKRFASNLKMLFQDYDLMQSRHFD